MEVETAVQAIKDAEDQLEVSLVTAYDDGRGDSLTVLSRRSGRSVEWIRQVLLRHGVTLRSRGAAGHRSPDG